MSLTKMKRAFIAAYTENPKLGQAEAARSAGCSVKRAKITAYEWMRDPEVKLEIQRQLSKKLGKIETAAPRKELTAEAVLQELDSIAEMCRQAGAGAWQAATLVKVVELKGKYLKLWTEKIEFGLDEKLIARLERGRKLAAGIPEAEATVIKTNPPKALAARPEPRHKKKRTA